MKRRRDTTEEELAATIDRQAKDAENVKAHLRLAGQIADLKIDNSFEFDCVYYVAACGRIKIGKSQCIAKRLRGLQTPEHPVLLAVEAGYTEREAEMHATFDHLRAYNEWFMPGKDLLVHIVAIRNAGNWWKNAPKPERKRWTPEFYFDRREAMRALEEEDRNYSASIAANSGLVALVGQEKTGSPFSQTG